MSRRHFPGFGGAIMIFLLYLKILLEARLNECFCCSTSLFISKTYFRVLKNKKTFKFKLALIFFLNFDL